MKPLLKRIFIPVLTITSSTLLGITPVAAETPTRGPVPFKQFDTNQDGVISEQEFKELHQQRRSASAPPGNPMREAAAMPPFEFFDTNGDKTITPPELIAGQQLHRQRQKTKAAGGANRPGMKMPHFSDFDLNQDGALTEQEFYDARNNRMSARASQGYPMKNAAHAPSFQDIDSNGDGRISPEEFLAHQAQHSMRNKSQMGRE